jgi:hypothetical protein
MKPALPAATAHAAPGRVPRAAWVLLLFAALGVAGYFAFHALFVKVGRSVEQPYSGPAKHNPFYVLQRYLEERGMRVQMVRAWPQPLTNDTVVLWFSDDAVPLPLRGWLAGGGQLWSFRDPDATTAPHAWQETPWRGEEPLEPEDEGGEGDPDQGESSASDESDAEPVASDGGANAVAGTDDESATAEPNNSATPEAPSQAADAGAAGAADDDEDAWDDGWCDEGCLSAAQFAYGRGCLTLVRQYGLVNDHVSRGETPARIDALLKCGARPRSVLIVTSVGSPWFGQLLLDHAPEALGAFLALLLLVLWRNGKHFGPRPAAVRRERRQLLEHVSAVGTLASRVGLAPLVGAARSQLRKQLLRRVPHAATLAPDALLSAVAEATDVPRSEVQRALFDELGTSSQEALQIARAMQALWRKT